MPAPRLEVREETAADIAAIEAVTIAAFMHAPHTSRSEQHIVNELRRAGSLILSLVAQAEDRVIGHVAVSPVSISDGALGWYGLGPLSVMPEHQGRGTGSALMREALRRLRGYGAAGCVLLGEPNYYQRFGFRANPGLTLPAVPPEYFLAIAFGSHSPRGIVSYHDAFDARAHSLRKD
jgi:putative acetyltransferase